mmetsp:Transcript_57005/g.148425  ORF Transcript_57005/g.148425 Transcript_57005/m.148425 type:complete len:321 (+) Transcript_57005:471-1433(+)
MHPDVALLTPRGTPTVPHQPIVHALFLPIAHEDHSVVDDGPLCAAPIEDAAAVPPPRRGRHAHRDGVHQHGLHECLRIVLRQLVIARDSGHSPLLADRVVALAVITPDSARVRPCPQTGQTVPGGVIEGQLCGCAHATARSSALLRVRHTRRELLGRELEQGVSGKCDGALHHGCGSEGPAASTGALVLHSRHHTRPPIPPIELLREIGALGHRPVPEGWLLTGLLHVAEERAHLIWLQDRELVHPSLPELPLLAVVLLDALHGLLVEFSALRELRLPIGQAMLLYVLLEGRVSGYLLTCMRQAGKSEQDPGEQCHDTCL